METVNNKQREEYNIFYVPNCPQTLTIINDKKTILGNLYSLASFFWIIPDRGSWARIQSQFQKQVGENLICCQSIQETKKQIKNKETVVIICQQSVVKNNIDIFSQDIESKKITHIICIGLPFSNKYKQITFANDPSKVFVEISQNRFSYNKANDFINFIFVSKEIWDSSILVKTMFAMLQQKTNRAQMLQYMGEVAQISCPPSKIGLVNQFVCKNINPQQTISSPIGWYTKQSFLYTFVNSILRLCKEPTALFVLQPYFKDLFLAIYQLYSKQQKIKSDENHNYKSFYCYPGAAISEKEVQQLKSNINSVVENLGFLSTSLQIDVANGFVINVLYQIEVHDEMRHPELDFGFAFVDKYSSKHGEQQIIFNPLNTFKIISVGQISIDIPMYIIKLKYGELARAAACNNSELNNEQMKFKILGQYRISERRKFNSIGDVLVGENFNLKGRGSLYYYEKYLQIALESKNQIYISNAYFRLGKYYQNAAQFDKMIQNYLKIQNFQKNKNQNDPNYCDFLSRLGTVYIAARQYEKATEYLYLCMNLTKKIYGPQSENYIVVLTNLSAAYINRGLCQQAEKYLNEVKKIQKEKHGENNQVYLSILNNLGTVYYRFGLYQKAIQNLEKALYLEATSVGENHPRCVKKYYNLALAYFRSDQYSKALPLFQKAETIQKKYSGQNSQSYLSISKFMGIIYLKLNKYELSIQYFKKCKIFYEANPSSFIKMGDYAQILFNMGEACIELEKYLQAVQYLRENRKIVQKMFGKYNYRCIKILISFGNTFIGLGQYDNALKCLVKAQFFQSHYFGWDNWQYSLIMYGLGIINQKYGYFQMALQYLTKCKSIQKNIADQNFDKIYGKTLVQIGHLYMKLDEFQKAIDNYYESLKYKKKIFGENHLEYALILSCKGQAYNHLGQFKKALKNFKQFQAIIKKIFGQTHPKYAQSLNKLAMVYQNLGSFQLAKELYGQSAVILSKFLGQNNTSYLKTLTRLSYLRFNLGQFQQSIQTCLKSGEKLLIEQLTTIIKKGQRINQIFSKFKCKTSLRIPLIKTILRDINEAINKNYSYSIKQVKWLRNVYKRMDNPCEQFIQILDNTEGQIIQMILSQIYGYYEIAHDLQSNGHYEEAEYIYSTYILMKYKEVAFVIPEIISEVEDELYQLKNKFKMKHEVNDTYTEADAQKHQFCYLDFHF